MANYGPAGASLNQGDRSGRNFGQSTGQSNKSPNGRCTRLARVPGARSRVSADVGPTNPEFRKRLDSRRIQHMSIDEVEAAALKLEPRARARLAGRLLESLDELSPEENARLWVEEAQRRAAALNAGSLSSRSAEDVFRDAQARI